MRIGMMADIYKPHVSGITNYIDLNKKYLEKAGHDVYVFTFGDDDYLDEEPNVVRSPGLPLVDTGYYLGVRYNKDAQTVLRGMDLVHVHHPFLSGRLALRYCKPRGIPIVFTNHTRYDLYAQAYLPGLPDDLGEGFLRAYLPGYCAAVDFVVAPSPGMKQVLERLGVTVPITVIPNGVDFSAFQVPLEPFDRQQFGFSQSDVLLIYVGRLGPEKNLPFLLRAFNGACQAFDNLSLLIVGDGPERDNLRDRVRLMGIDSKVHFTGMVPYKEIPRYLVTADVFVTASLTEVHPLSVIEAMGAGLPVLGIDSPGVGDSIVDGETGFLVPEDDLAAFTAKLVRLVTRSDERQAMSKNARQCSERYDIRHTTRLMITHYESLFENFYHRQRTLRHRFFQFLNRWRS